MRITNMEIADIKKNRQVDERCKTCFLKTYTRLLDKFDIDRENRQLFISYFNDIVNKMGDYPHPFIQRELQDIFTRITNIEDPFSEEKSQHNLQALKIYKEWKSKVLDSAAPYNLSLRLAIAGNVMDYAANSDFDINKTISKILKVHFSIDKSSDLNQRIKQAKNILYLGDNAGEIVFDRLFIETIMHNNVIYVVKGGPALNDVNISDAKEVGIDIVADVISNGYNAPSTLLQNCSIEFLEAYKNADLIISKGQGNFEGLLHENDPRIFFLLMVKCDVIAEKLNVEKGSFVVTNKP